MKHLMLVLIILLGSCWTSTAKSSTPRCWNDFVGGGEPFPLGDQLESSMWALDNKSFSHPLFSHAYFRFRLERDSQKTSFIVTLHDAQTHLEIGIGQVSAENGQSQIRLKVIGQSVSLFFHLRSFYRDNDKHSQEKVLILSFMDLLDPSDMNKCISTIKLQEL